jgi:protein gp37
LKETKISWAHATVNFWTGCNHVSAECEGCYADTLLTRTGRDFTTLALTQTWSDAYEVDKDAAREGGTKIIFTCSLSDFFHLQADRWRGDAWNVIRDCQHVHWLVLTKRPERIRDHLPADWGEHFPHVCWVSQLVAPTPITGSTSSARFPVPCDSSLLSRY